MAWIGFSWPRDDRSAMPAFTTTLSKVRRQVAIRMNPNHQFKNMLGELQKGMALVTSYWLAQSEEGRI